MVNPFWINRHPYHHRVFCVLADTLDTIIALLSFGLLGSSFGFSAVAYVTKRQIQKKIKEQRNG